MMFRSCAFFVRVAKMRFGTERMRQALRKILVLALSVGLAVSAPALSHARTGLSSVAASHESHDLQSYADLAIEPGDDGCPHSASGPTHDQDEGLCKKCCAACLGASLLPEFARGCADTHQDQRNWWSNVTPCWSLASYPPNPAYLNASEHG